MPKVVLEVKTESGELIFIEKISLELLNKIKEMLALESYSATSIPIYFETSNSLRSKSKQGELFE